MKAKYDTVAQMWDSLPTNAELLQRQGLTEEEEMVGVRMWWDVREQSCSYHLLHLVLNYTLPVQSLS